MHLMLLFFACHANLTLFYWKIQLVADIWENFFSSIHITIKLSEVYLPLLISDKLFWWVRVIFLNYKPVSFQ